MTLSPNMLPVLSGLAAFVVVILIWSAFLESDPLPARLRALADQKRALQKHLTAPSSRKADARSLSRIRQLVKKLNLLQSDTITATRIKLAQAGYRSRDALTVYLFLRLALPAAIALLVAIFTLILPLWPLPALHALLATLTAALAASFLPNIFLKNQTQKRQDVLRKAMPDAFDLLVISAEAGLSLDAALDRVARETGRACPLLAEEIGITALELSFLPERAKALQDLASRVPIDGVSALANTLIQTERYGTPLAEALRVLAAEMRSDRMMKAEEKAARLPAIMTVPMILFILPPLFIVLLGPAILRVLDTMKGMH
jgi:tight adherence protein C